MSSCWSCPSGTEGRWGLAGFGLVDEGCRLRVLDLSTWIDIEQEERKMSRFMQFGVAATREALEDAAWHPVEEHAKEMTVPPSPLFS